MLRISLIIILLQIAHLSIASTELVFNSRVATTLSGVNLYPDSTYEKQSNGTLKVGELLEIIGETVLEHEDASQNQKFKWFKIKSPGGKEGWVYGDGIAVIIPENRIEDKLKAFHKKKHHFNNGFEQSTMWVAGIEGRDNFHQQDLLNPPYKEYYLVISNDRGNCVFINYSSENARGQMDLRHIVLDDTTGDGVPELLLQTSSFAPDVDFENRNFEIFSFQAGGLQRIFEERMSLSTSTNIHAPSLFKYVEVDHEIIRVAYIDYLPCTNYSIDNGFDGFNKQKDLCMEYVTYTYSWNERTRQYRMIYDESRTAPAVGSRKSISAILNEPSESGISIGTVTRSDRMEVIKQHKKAVIENGIHTSVLYFYVKLKDGKNGYLKASEVGFIDIEYVELLNQYYRSISPSQQKMWRTQKHFLNIVGDNRSSYSDIRKPK